eukprot:6350273-Pyramimonas_sp.AAC.1
MSQGTDAPFPHAVGSRCGQMLPSHMPLALSGAVWGRRAGGRSWSTLFWTGTGCCSSIGCRCRSSLPASTTRSRAAPAATPGEARPLSVTKSLGLRGGPDGGRGRGAAVGAG